MDKKPDIRFTGFTDAWEQRKLGEVADLLTGFPFESKKFVSEGIKLVRGMNVKRGYLDFSEELCEYWATSVGLENYLLKDGDVLIQMDGALIGKSYAKIEENQLPALLVQRVTRVRILNQIADESFIYQQIQKGFLAYIKGAKTETAVPHLSLSDIENFQITIPTADEQKKIGTLFENLDYLITLHQRKYDRLVNLKKAMLEKMFPKEGECVPEIRFGGFTEPWERRKLGQIADKVTEKNETNTYNEPLTNSAELGVISQREYFDRTIVSAEKLDGYYIVKDGDFVYNPRISVTAPVGPVNQNKLGRTGVMSPLYTVFRTHNVSKGYLEYFFKGSHWHSFMKLNGDSGARSDRFSIKDNVFFQMPIPYPSIEEQVLIGKYLEKLDRTVFLYQRKLQKLQECKKAFLEKMFVGGES